MEWYLDMIARDSPGFVILTVSINIIIDPIHGDIATAKTRAMWLHYIIFARGMWQVSCWATYGARSAQFSYLIRSVPVSSGAVGKE